MRSYGGIWVKIVSEENLRKAWRRVRRGHAPSVAVQEFEACLDVNLACLRDKLINGRYRPSDYRQFRIFDPKPRTISCAPVADRVVHHALCGVIAPLIERSFVPVSFACRKGYGAHAACALVRRYAGQAKYFCKMDIRKYFDSIGHEWLLGVLLPKFRETSVKNLIELIVRHPVPGLSTGRGLPIGNLTSQWFANAYLDAFDHLAICGMGAIVARRGFTAPSSVPYVRYMDDFVFFADSKAMAWHLHDEAKRWLEEERGLEVKDGATVVAPVSDGVPFLGLRIWPNCWRLKRVRFIRTRRTYAQRVRQFENGMLNEKRFAQCVASSDGASRWFGFKGILKDLASKEGSSSGSNRVKRGGSWNNNADNCNSSNRNNNNPSNENNNDGFRLVSTVSEQTGFHFGTPVLRETETNMHNPGRPVAQATAAPEHFQQEE
ncbi:MAG: RNA-dependent DNA polymerase [Kiritimatiellae bacterium]|nr:RNA-dependent DNA polymerase [Kiritimatiellia bacterium]